MAKKKSNWDLIRKQKDTESVKYRDVYEDQQLERGSIAEKQTMTSRVILAGVAGLLAGALVWTIVSAIQMGTRKAGLDDDENPVDDYIHVEPYYYNVNDTKDVLSVAEYEEWYQQYHDFDSQRDSADTIEVPMVPVNDMADYVGSYHYQDDTGMYEREGEMFTAEQYQQAVRQHEEEYKAAKDAYDLYYHQRTDPEYREGDDTSGVYTPIIGHYKKVDNLDFVVSDEDYQKLLDNYENVTKATLSEDILDIPLKPIEETSFYEGISVWIPNTEYWHMKHYDEIHVSQYVNKELFDEFVKEAMMSNIDLSQSPYSLDPIPQPDPKDTAATAAYAEYQAFHVKIRDIVGDAAKSPSYADCWQAFVDYCNEVHYNRDPSQRGYSVPTDMICVNTSFRNKLDGTLISFDEYHEMDDAYQEAFADWQKVYMKHRETYHPDDIYGNASIFTMAANPTKVLSSLAVAIILFASLYMIFKKNLDAQNQMSDTADINQYHNDQHVALPEEVQKNYDWFPDVGAHSAVQVSSMISHMAISNKGLKKVKMAKRAKDDIRDEDGSIIYYKGEMLLDDDGNPITTEEPIIDTDFMEALFDASGAPKDKQVRHYYDPTKIPYNPGNGNRDKLQDKKNPYETVADLINRDWDFPIYEPQRPGGAYIVDTAPVNTMVLAITRAGKGQTVIEPTLDMWMREKRPNNMVVNDPKGELLVKNYVRATVRGLQVVQFNLINAIE